jgi:hypothetical protein
MSKGRHAFKETDVTRAIRAWKKAGLGDPTVRITKDALELKSGEASQPSTAIIDGEATEVIL